MSEKKFSPNIGFWPAKSGNGYTVFIDENTRAELVRLLDEAAEGRRLYLGEVESKNKKAPSFRLSVLPEGENRNEGI